MENNLHPTPEPTAPSAAPGLTVKLPPMAPGQFATVFADGSYCLDWTPAT